MTLRVVHVLTPARFGGLERVVETLAMAQVRAAQDVHVVASAGPGSEGHPLFGSLRRSGVAVHEIAVPMRAYLRERRVLRQFFSDLAPNIIHSHGYRSDVLAGAVARDLGFATISTAHGFVGGGARNRLYEWLQRRSLRSYDAVVAVSRPLVLQLQAAGIARDHIHFVQNAWAPQGQLHSPTEARHLLGLPAEGRVIGWVGRLSHEKGPDVMLEALAALPNEPEARLAMLGDGPQLGALQAIAGRLGIAGLIHWVGAVPNAYRFFRAFDAFALSSRTEGTPLVLLEAMGAGVPIIATRVGGVGDVIGSEEGLLVPSENPVALSTALHAVLMDGAASQRRAALASARLAREFGLDEWVAQYAQVYHEVLSRRGNVGARAALPVAGQAVTQEIA
jgi:glycosyltransferase involved in cell wall biosynthesis